MATAPAFLDGDVEICPPYWPQHLWEILKLKKTPGPVYSGYGDIFSALAIHALSYELLDEEKARQVRALVVDAVPHTVARLGELGGGQ